MAADRDAVRSSNPGTGPGDTYSVLVWAQSGDAVVKAVESDGAPLLLSLQTTSKDPNARNMSALIVVLIY